MNPDLELSPQEVSTDVWNEKYRLRNSAGVPVDLNMEYSRLRVSSAIAEVEKPELRAKYNDQFYNALAYAIPAGRIYSNAGATEHKRAVSLINCVVSDTVQDEMESILYKLYESGLSLKAGCGIGYEFSTLRPKGSHVFGAGATTSGPLSFMDTYDKMCFTISSAGGRRGAQMATFAVSHPDVVEFIKAKREDGRLRQFNLSILITDEFMQAVLENQEWFFKWDGKPTGKSMPARELWDLIMKSTYNFAEPGFLLIDRINKYNNLWFCENLRATNPCVTGDTLIAVAGRGPVPIKQLVEEGEDVPVYCQDVRTGETLVRMGRNPRKTGIGHKVYKVTLDDGTSFKANAVHGLYLRDGTKVKVKDLVQGDSLIPFEMLAHDSGNSVVRNNRTGKRRKDYWLMLECKYGRKFKFGTGTGSYHGHHIDGDHFHNSMENLEALRHEEHCSHHLTENNPMQTWWPNATSKERARYLRNLSLAKSGEGNGMYGKVHSKRTKRLIGLTTSDRFENDPDFRRLHKKTVTIAMNRPETRARLSAAMTKEREIVKVRCEWCRKKFEVEVIVGRGTKRKYCSQLCASAASSAYSATLPRTQETLDAISRSSRAFAATKRGRRAKKAGGQASVAARALKCGSMLLYQGYRISYRTWDSLKQVLHESGIKPTISADWIDAHWEGDWKQFTRECRSYNHKVVSVKYVGREDVYNITVDEVHNYFIVTGEQRYKKSTVYTGILSKNCGEQPLPPYGSCLLGSINLTKFVCNPFTDSAYFDFDKFEEIIRIFTRMLDNVVEINGLPLPQQRFELETKRRHGMGFLGLGSAMTMLGLTYGSPASVSFTSEVAKSLAMTSFDAGVDLAIEKGEAPILKEEFSSVDIQNSPSAAFNSNMHYELETYTGRQLLLQSHYFDAWRDDARGAEILKRIAQHGSRFTHATSLAPTGTISLALADNCSGGIEPTFSHSYVRNIIREGRNAKEAVTVYSHEFRLYKHLVDSGTIHHKRVSLTQESEMLAQGLDPTVPHPQFMPETFSTADSISPEHHIAVQAAAQQWIDSSISKTINVPTDCPFEQFQDIYIRAYEAGLKGCTTFRFNPEAFGGVLVREEDLKNTHYTFVLQSGEEKTYSGNTLIEYEGQTQTAANLYDAFKEGHFKKF